MTNPEKIARTVASIVAATRYAHSAWAALDHAEQEKIILVWTEFVRDDPETAADQILAHILAHGSLGEAWRKLGDIDGQPKQHPAIVYLVSLGKEGETLNGHRRDRNRDRLARTENPC